MISFTKGENLLPTLLKRFVQNEGGLLLESSVNIIKYIFKLVRLKNIWLSDSSSEYLFRKWLRNLMTKVHVTKKIIFQWKYIFHRNTYINLITSKILNFSLKYSYGNAVKLCFESFYYRHINKAFFAE